MELKYNSATLALAEDLTQPPFNLRLPVTQVVETVPLFKGADASVLARGNRSRQLTITVPRLYASNRLAEEAFLQHADSLPVSATMEFITGRTGDTSTKEADAVLESCIPTLRGFTVIFDYIFHCSPFITPTT